MQHSMKDCLMTFTTFICITQSQLSRNNFVWHSLFMKAEMGIIFIRFLSRGTFCFKTWYQKD